MDQRTVVSTGQTVVLIAETVFLIVGKMISKSEIILLPPKTIVFVIEKIFSVAKTIVFVIEKMFFVAKAIVFVVEKTMVGTVSQGFAHRILALIGQSFANPAGCFWSTSPLASFLIREVHSQSQLINYNPTVIAL